MDQSPIPATTSVRHDGWTETRRMQFLEHLAGRGNVRAACACVGLSPEAAYRLRRRDALFARAWAAALDLARVASAQVLACRAIDGIEEDVWHRGEIVGTRRRYDTRLLLAHLARLDALAGRAGARDDTARFDELVALAGGARPPEGLVCDDDGMPLSRAASIELAIEVATEAACEEAQDAAGAGGNGDDGEAWQLPPAERYLAAAEAAARWDTWVADACLTVDRLAQRPDASLSRTPSTPSTSPLAEAPAGGQPRS